MKIIVDAMGGDNAPMALVEGAIEAVKENDTDVILVGSGEEILRCMEKLGLKNIPKGIEIAHTSQVITMEDDPATAVREKKDSSMTVALNLLKNNTGDALLSAGSTGALLSGATLLVKRIRGIRRAALAPVLPDGHGGCILIDCGANAECTVEYLVQFAYLGASYARHVLDKENPRVGLLNIGEEASKGTPLQKETYAYLTRARESGKLNFIGNIEGRDILFGHADVVVCDGFSGNVLLKGMEGMGLYMIGELKKVFADGAMAKFGALLAKNKLRALRKRLDYTEVGGSVLLGISKPVIKAHGASNATAIKNAIHQAVKMASSGIISEITDRMDDMRLPRVTEASETDTQP